MTIELTEDIEVSEEVYITVDNVTINGNGHTITAADDFKTNASGQDVYKRQLLRAGRILSKSCFRI